jgi:adenosylcobinamide-phosphate synthase
MPLTLLALLVELMLGYPDALVRAVGHPVTWMGRLINALDRWMNPPVSGERAQPRNAVTSPRKRGEVGRRAIWERPSQRRIAGFVALAIVIIVVGGIAWLIAHSLLRLSFGIVILAVIASTLLAQRSLYAHVARVAAALERDGLAAARTAVAQIVGRDPEALDEAGVARAAIESLAENFSDGVVAPALWMAVGGLPGAAVYKAINTADSMIGHRTERHEDFGCAAARLDDLVNLPASRLAALLIVAAAALTDPASAGKAWRAVVRDAPRHRSPNAGYPEAAMAGALGLALAGPRRYGGVVAEDAVMGDGKRDAGATDVRAALALYRRADALLIGLVAVLTAIVIVVW